MDHRAVVGFGVLGHPGVLMRIPKRERSWMAGRKRARLVQYAKKLVFAPFRKLDQGAGVLALVAAERIEAGEVLLDSSRDQRADLVGGVDDRVHRFEERVHVQAEEADLFFFG